MDADPLVESVEWRKTTPCPGTEVYSLRINGDPIPIRVVGDAYSDTVSFAWLVIAPTMLKRMGTNRPNNRIERAVFFLYQSFVMRQKALPLANDAVQLCGIVTGALIGANCT